MTLNHIVKYYATVKKNRVVLKQQRKGYIWKVVHDTQLSIKSTVHKINIQLNELSHTYTHRQTHRKKERKNHYPGKEREGSLYSIVYEIHLCFHTWL